MPNTITINKGGFIIIYYDEKIDFIICLAVFNIYLCTPFCLIWRAYAIKLESEIDQDKEN